MIRKNSEELQRTIGAGIITAAGVSRAGEIKVIQPLPHQIPTGRGRLKEETHNLKV